MNGLEATQQIRKIPERQKIPIMAMTANAFAEDKLRCFEAGMNDFIVKPIAPEKIFVSLLKWLERGATWQREIAEASARTDDRSAQIRQNNGRKISPTGRCRSETGRTA